jgi:hypothetical protein
VAAFAIFERADTGRQEAATMPLEILQIFFSNSLRVMGGWFMAFSFLKKGDG